MFWTEDGRGKKEKRKDKSVTTWVDEKKGGEKKKEKKKRSRATCVERKKKGEKRNYIIIFSQYFYNKF